MILSRLWYVVLSLLLGISAYVVFLAVGEYDRRNGVAMEEELASDSQTVGWALQIDARRRLDALLIGAVDRGIQDSLQAAAGKDTIPGKAKEDGRRALNATLEKIPVDFRPDALFAVDHEGRVVSQVGFDAANQFPDFELGGYPAVFDALHGYLRDDTWVLGGKPYRVSARPVEVDSTQPPLGALVALKAVDKKFAQEISKRTRANVAFFADGKRLAAATVAGFDESKLTAIDGDLGTLAADKSYADGRSDLHLIGDSLGAFYARFLGDAWDLGAGFVVVRSRTTIGGPLGFLNGADDKDKQSVNIALIAVIVVLGFVIGIALTVVDHTLPLRQMEKQAAQLSRGELDYLQVARFRGGYRGIAENVNAGIERVLEKGGGAVRKPADLESILGPVPVQPSMSAFSFPLPDAAPAAAIPAVPPARQTGNAGFPAAHAVAQAAFTAPPVNAALAAAARPRPTASPAASPFAIPQAPPAQAPATHALPPAASAPAATAAGPVSSRMTGPRASSPAFPPAGPPIPPPASVARANPANFQIAPDDSFDSVDEDGPTMASALSPAGNPMVPTRSPLGDGPLPPPAASRPRPAAGTPGVQPPPVGKGTMMGMGIQAQSVAASARNGENEDESTVIARAPSEILAAASGPAKAVNDETAEWMSVYDEFLRTKKQCDEPTDGLSFEKFQNTLRKNRDALVQRHQCKRVRFSVYIKDGRASLKATPVKE